MRKAISLIAGTTLGIAVLSFTPPAKAGDSLGAAIAGFGIGAILGSFIAPAEVYFVPPPPPYYYYDSDYYYGPAGYGPQPRGRSRYSRSKTAAANPPGDGARPGPTRSTTLKTPIPAGAAQQASEAKFKIAQAKAERLGGVHKLTSEDIDGLSREQLKRLRGY